MNLCKRSSNSYDFELKNKEPVRGLINNNEIKTYKIRWFILVVICLVNISNGINW